MKWTLIVIEAALLGAILSLASCGEVGRYQMVVTQAVQGDGMIIKPASIHVCDTKTGQVWSKQVEQRVMLIWDPLNGTFTGDSVTVIKGDK